MQPAHATPEVAIRDESKLVDAAQSNRGDTKTPLDAAVMDLLGPPLQAHTAPALAGDTNTSLVHDTQLVHSTQYTDC